MAEKIDLNTLPKGLTKEEFTALPNFKKIRSFFTWAGVVIGPDLRVGESSRKPTGTGRVSPDHGRRPAFRGRFRCVARG